jgi:hypothetical protein
MRRILWIGLIAPLLASSAFGWGCEGHQIVALIARAHLTPEVSAAVDELLREKPIDPALSRFCKDRPDDLMADAATWADDVRNQEKNGPWHYVNIPRSATSRTPLEAWCPPIGPSVNGKDQPGCVVNAIEYQLAVLRDKSRSAADRATALRYVIHFVGDIHQPLHDVDNQDQGGNCTTMQVVGDDRLTNLHSIWDTKLIQHEMETDQLTKPAYVEALNSRFAAKYPTLAAAPVDDPSSWSWEAAEIARNVTYGNLEPGLPVAHADTEPVCAAEREKVQALHIVIGETYIRKAIPVIEEQLATAGFRLALLLNATL